MFVSKRKYDEMVRDRNRQQARAEQAEKAVCELESANQEKQQRINKVETACEVLEGVGRALEAHGKQRKRGGHVPRRKKIV